MVFSFWSPEGHTERNRSAEVVGLPAKTAAERLELSVERAYRVM
jgi:hypothetical protein